MGRCIQAVWSGLVSGLVLKDRIPCYTGEVGSTNRVKENAMATEPSERVGTKIMFENERVRVWDLKLAPGESLDKHIHRTNYFFIVESGGLIRFANPDDPTDYRDVQFA